MVDEEKVREATIRLYRPYFASTKIQQAYYDVNGKENSIDDDTNLIEELIQEHFNNTLDFKCFELYDDSTMKTWKKSELIDYIHMLYHNWRNCDACLQRQLEISDIL